MRIVIDIDERVYDICCNNSAGKIMPLDVVLMKKAIQNGTPVPQEKSEGLKGKGVENEQKEKSKIM